MDKEDLQYVARLLELLILQVAELREDSGQAVNNAVDDLKDARDNWLAGRGQW